MTPPRHHDRYPYSPIPARPVYDWPGGRRLAVYVGLNLEWFSFGEGLGAELVPAAHQPDVLNYAWRDYGNRVGVFRLADLFAELKLPVSLLVNADIYTHAPQAVAAFAKAEIVGHGRSNSERQGTLSESDERALIAQTTAAIEKHSGARPSGWLGRPAGSARACSGEKYPAVPQVIVGAVMGACVRCFAMPKSISTASRSPMRTIIFFGFTSL